MVPRKVSLNFGAALINLSLRTKLILVFLLITLLTTGLMTAFTTVAMRDKLVNDAGHNLKNQAASEALTLSNVIQREIDKLQAFALNQLIVNRINEQNNLLNGTPEQIRDQINKLDDVYRVAADDTPFLKRILEGTAADELHEYVRRFPISAELMVTDEAGGLVAASQRTRDYAQADETWWQKAWNDGHGAIYVSNVTVGETTQALSLIIAVPVYTKGSDRVIGVLRNTYQLSGLTELTRQIRVGSTGRGYLLFSPGASVAQSDSSLVFENDALTWLRAGQSQDFIETKVNGVPSLLSQTPIISSKGEYPSIDALGWRLLLAQDSQETLQPIATATQAILAIGVGILVFAILFAVLNAYVISLPIRQLTRTAQHIAAGDLSHRVAINSHDEIGQLAASFNTMVSAVEERDHDLKAGAELLEQRVEQRTSELVSSQRRLEQVSRAKSVFISNMSHELRTPLNVIIGYTSSMLDMPRMYNFQTLPDVFRNDIELIRDNGRYLLGLINDILDMSKIEAGKLDMNWSRVNLNDVFKGIMPIAIGLVRDKPIQVRLEVPDNLPIIWGDMTRVRQIILNLTSNAIKFTKSGSVTLRAQTRADRVTISVIDTGIGIPEKALDKIFDRFQQAEHGIESQYGGTGLGLDICKQLVEMHGSALTVNSIVGEGSNFSFDLMIATADNAPTQKPLSTVGSIDSQIFDEVEQGAEIRSILLVEDDTPTRNLLHRTMESSSYLVIDIEDGATAAEMAYNVLPDAIVLDILLPNVDGWQVIKDLRARPETAAIPIVVCTNADNRTKAKDFGVDAFLQKPVTPEQVLQAIEQVLSVSKVEDK